MSQPVVAAATIVLMSEVDGKLSVFMQERHRNSKAFRSMLVFPGGKVEPGDRDLQWRQYCDAGASEDDEQLAHQVAAIRETFEESGVLLARAAGDGHLLAGERVDALSGLRAVLQSGELSFVDFVREHHLLLACDGLDYFAHWITPEFESRRFDTRFFMARVPASQHSLLGHDGHEAVDSLWIEPDTAVADARAGRRKLIFPTIRNLERLAQYATIEAARQGCAQCAVQAIQPEVDQRDDGIYIRIPANVGYPVCEERIPDDVVKILMEKAR
jgi:8-oxo-dGTP pyrophosphatase MutT (NUDIX family)